MPDIDAKEFIETHLPGSLEAISDLVRRQLEPFRLVLSSVSGMQAGDGLFKQIAIRLYTAFPDKQVAQQAVICNWAALHRLKLESIRFDPRAQEFVLFVTPPVPVLAKHAK